MTGSDPRRNTLLGALPAAELARLEPDLEPVTSERGFASMDEEQQREIARKGGEASAQSQKRDDQGQFDGSRQGGSRGNEDRGSNSGGDRGGDRGGSSGRSNR